MNVFYGSGQELGQSNGTGLFAQLVLCVHLRPSSSFTEYPSAGGFLGEGLQETKGLWPVAPAVGEGSLKKMLTQLFPLQAPQASSHSPAGPGQHLMAVLECLPPPTWDMTGSVVSPLGMGNLSLPPFTKSYV